MIDENVLEASVPLSYFTENSTQTDGHQLDLVQLVHKQCEQCGNPRQLIRNDVRSRLIIQFPNLF